jgi:hypothetical protein
VAGMLLSLVYLKAIQWLAPFKDPTLNRIKETSVWQIFFVFTIALLIKMDDIDSDVLTFCLLLAFSINFFIMIGQYLVQSCGRHVVTTTRRRHVDSTNMNKDSTMEDGVEMEITPSSLLPSSSSSSSSSSASITEEEEEGGAGGRHDSGGGGSDVVADGHTHSPFHHHH